MTINIITEAGWFVTKIAAQGFVFAQSLRKRICHRLGSMLCTVSSKILRCNRALLYFLFRWMGSDSALAFQPVAAFLTELLQREVVKKECHGTAGASVAIFDCSGLGFGRPTGRIVHSFASCIGFGNGMIHS